jgi:cytoskeletal protein CcmA (bactofilin family)
VTNSFDGIPRLGAGTTFDGVLSFEGSLRIDGELSGTVYATQGALIIGPQARVRARVEVAELVLAGALVGDVVAHRRVELLPGAELEGDLRSPRLAIAEGGRIAGRCHTGEGALGAAPKSS